MITPREIQIAYETDLFYYIFFLGPLTASLGEPPAAHSDRCTMRGGQPRKQKHPKSHGTAANGDCTCSKKPPRPERSQRYSGARGSGNAAISTYPPHRSSSVRFHAPRSRSPVLLVSALFRAPRYSAQRGTLRPVRAQRRPARRYSHRSRSSYELSKYRRP